MNIMFGSFRVDLNERLLADGILLTTITITTIEYTSIKLV